MIFDKKLIWEAVKEPLRWLVLSILPFLIAYFAQFNYFWALAITFVLRFIDKYLHLEGKAKDDDNLLLGITRF